MKNIMKKVYLLSFLSLSMMNTAFAGGGGDIFRTNVIVDSLEYQFNDEKTLYWDSSAYLGYDENKFYLYSEGESNSVSTNSESQALFSHAIASFWDLQVGLDSDKVGSNTKNWAVIALSGLAPYFFETRATLLIGAKGNIGLRLDAEYEALITQKLILTPKFTLDSYTQSEIGLGLGKGLSNITMGARLRYEIRREFAPYIGFEWSKNLGETQTLSRLDSIYFVSGLRFWF